jgi:hypothetical protein
MEEEIPLTPAQTAFYRQMVRTAWIAGAVIVVFHVGIVVAVALAKHPGAKSLVPILVGMTAWALTLAYWVALRGAIAIGKDLATGRAKRVTGIGNSVRVSAAVASTAKQGREPIAITIGGLRLGLRDPALRQQWHFARELAVTYLPHSKLAIAIDDAGAS